MLKEKKLVVGKPYNIMVNDNTHLLKAKGNCLSKECAEYLVLEGFIDKDEVDFGDEEDKKKINLPSFDEVVANINSKFPRYKNIVEALFLVYPSLVFSLILREYSLFIRQNFTPKKGDKIFLISQMDYKIFDFIVPDTDCYLDMIDPIAYFPSVEIAEEVLNKTISGLFTKYDK